MNRAIFSSRGGICRMVVALMFLLPAVPALLHASEPPGDLPPPDPEAHAKQAEPFQVPVSSGVSPWIEAARYRFPAYSFLKAPTFGGDRIYSLGRNHDTMVVFRRSDLALRAEIPLGERETPVSRPDGMVYAEREGARRLVHWQYGESRLRIFDLADPDHPALFRDVQGCFSTDEVSALPGGEQVLQYSGFYHCMTIVDPFTGEALSTIRTATRMEAMALGGTPKHPRVAVVVKSQTGPWRLQLYDLTDPAAPVLLSDSPFPDGRVWPFRLDRTGTLVVFGETPEDDVWPIRLVDAATGRVLGVIEENLEGRGAHNLLLADGGARPYVVVTVNGAVTSYDAGDPGDPRRVGTLNEDLYGPYEWKVEGVESPSTPLVFLASHAERQVLVFDASTATVVGRWPCDEGDLSVVRLSEGPRGRTLLAGLRRRNGREVLAPGGDEALEETDWTLPGEPRRLALHIGDSISRVWDVVTLDGRYVADYDLETNTLAVMDAADGTLAGTSGFQGEGGASHHGEEILAAGGGTIVLGVRWEPGYEVFDMTPQGPVSRGVYLEDGPDLLTAAVRKDGVVVAVTMGGVETLLPDGRRGWVPLEDSFDRAVLSPDGRRLLLTNIWWTWRGSVAVVSLDDPAHPELLWVRRDEVSSGARFVSGAHFVRDGAVVAATIESWPLMGFYPILYDTETGEPLGPPGPLVVKYAYHGPGVSFGRGADARMVWWRWTWYGWRSEIFDVSGDSPELILESPEYFNEPYYAVRSDGDVAYENRAGYLDWSTVWLLHTDGAMEEKGPVDQTEIVPLRHGFLAGPASLNRRTLVVNRDPEMNRPPQANAGPDRTIECAGPTGTPATLDGRNSSDPDSTPGTSDDIAGWRWTLDGATAGDEPVLETTLDLGDHRASLAVTDRIGAADEDHALLTVADTLPPDVSLSLDPVMEGNLFAHLWIAQGAVTDWCDGELGPPEEWLVLDPEVLGAPSAYRYGEADAVLVFRDAKGLRVELWGPDEARLRALWSDAAAQGGLMVADSVPMRMLLEDETPRQAPRNLASRFDLTADGTVTAAERYEPGADLRIVARGQDHAGHTAGASVSLRERIAELCAPLPEGLDCLLR